MIHYRIPHITGRVIRRLKSGYFWNYRIFNIRLDMFIMQHRRISNIIEVDFKQKKS